MLIFILQAGDKNGQITSFLQKAAVVAVRVSPARGAAARGSAVARAAGQPRANLARGSAH